MKIRKFRGPSANSLLREIRETLGPEVHLLETRMIRRPGLLGFFRPRIVEMSVAYEVAGERNETRRASARTRRIEAREASPRKRDDLRSNRLGTRDESPAATTEDDCSEVDPASGDRNPEIEKLVRLGVPQHAAKPMLRAGLHRDGARNLERLPWLRGVPILPGNDDGSGPRVVALVGPTGAGKTTTCAKLAARLSLGRDVRVGLVSLDTYRVGAVEQLRTYARILRVPLEVVTDADEAAPVLRRMNSCEVIILDTTGRSHRDSSSLRQLAQLLEAFAPDETHLVVGLNTDLRDAESIVAAYRTFDYNRILVTKIDETECPGKVVSIVERAGVPLSYVATGQDVPDHLETPGQAVPRLLREAMSR